MEGAFFPLPQGKEYGRKRRKNGTFFQNAFHGGSGLDVGSVFYCMLLKGILLSFFCQTLKGFFCAGQKAS